MRQFLNQNIQQVFWHPVDEWLNDHPLWQWFLLHPLILLSICILTLILLAGLMSAIAHLTQNLWLQLLRFPVRLVQWLGKAIAIVIQYGLIQPVLTWMGQTPSSNRENALFDASPVDKLGDDKGTQAMRSQSIRSNSAPSLNPSQQVELERLLERLEKVHQEEVDLMEKIKALIRPQSTL